MTYTFTIETAQPDSHGDTVLLDGVQLHDNIRVLHNFRRDQLIATVPVVFRDGDVLKCTAEIPDEYLDKYPAIGFQVQRWSWGSNGRIYERIKLFAVGLCDEPNLNPSIKTIREQINHQP